MTNKYVIKKDGKYLGIIFADSYTIEENNNIPATLFFENKKVIAIMRDITVTEGE